MTYKRIVAVLSLISALLIGVFVQKSYTQTRVSTTAGVVTIRSIIDGVLSFSDGLTLGDAWVKLSGDGDGAITFLGLGDGSDEDLTLNLDDTADTVAVSSSTGVTNINFGAIKAVLPEGSRTAVALQFGTGNEGISAITSSGRLGLSAGGLNSALVVSG